MLGEILKYTHGEIVSLMPCLKPGSTRSFPAVQWLVKLKVENDWALFV
jgi:hypothetical protein